VLLVGSCVFTDLLMCASAWLLEESHRVAVTDARGGMIRLAGGLLASTTETRGLASGTGVSVRPIAPQSPVTEQVFRYILSPHRIVIDATAPDRTP
jgi:hypothetical protein